jgi:hypothetical protein
MGGSRARAPGGLAVSPVLPTTGDDVLVGTADANETRASIGCRVALAPVENQHCQPAREVAAADEHGVAVQHASATPTDNSLRVEPVNDTRSESSAWTVSPLFTSATAGCSGCPGSGAFP